MPATLACARCDGPIQGEELLQGLAVRVDGDLVCALCIDTLPEDIQAGIAQTRAAKGLAPLLRRLPHPLRADVPLYVFIDSAGLAQHRRTKRAGKPLAEVVVRPPRRGPPWLPWVALGGGLLVLGALGSVLFLPVRSAPSVPPVTPPAPPPTTPPKSPTPVTHPVVVDPAPAPAPLADPVVPMVMPTPVLPPTPVLVVAPPAPPASPVLPAPPPPVVVAAPPQVVAAPTPAPAEPVVDDETPAKATPPGRTPLDVTWWSTGGRPVNAWDPQRSSDRPPLPAPLLADGPAPLLAAQEAASGPGRGRRSLTLHLHGGLSTAGGVVLALHAGRTERKQLLVTLLATNGTTISSAPVPVSDGWQPVVLPMSQDGSIVLSDLTGITTPFWITGGIAVAGQPPVADLLGVRPSPLLLGDDRRWRESLEAAVQARGRTARLDPARFQVLLEEGRADAAVFARWQTPVRKALAPLVGEKLPNGTLDLRPLFKSPKEALLPDRDRAHLLLVGFEGTDAALSGAELRARWGILRQAAGGKAGQLLVPILGHALVPAAPHPEWGAIRTACERNGTPCIDLRGIPPDETGAALAAAVTSLVQHLQYLVVRLK